MSQQPNDPQADEFIERLYRGIADRAMLTAMEHGFPTDEGMEKTAHFFADAVIHHLNELAEQHGQMHLLGAFYANLRDAMAKEDGTQ